MRKAVKLYKERVLESFYDALRNKTFRYFNRAFFLLYYSYFILSMF